MKRLIKKLVGLEGYVSVKEEDLARWRKEWEITATERDQIRVEKESIRNQMQVVRQERDNLLLQYESLQRVIDSTKREHEQTKNSLFDSIEALQQELSAAKRDNQKLRDDAKIILSDLETIKIERESLHREKSRLDENINALQEEYNLYKQKHEGLQEELQLLSRDVNILKQERDELTDKLLQSQSQLESADKEKSCWNQERESGRLEREALAGEHQKTRNERDILLKQCEDLLQERESGRLEREALAGEHQKTRNERDILLKQCEDLLQERENWIQERASCQRNQELLKSELLMVQQEQERLKENLVQSRSESESSRREREILLRERESLFREREEIIRERMALYQERDALREELQVVKKEREELLLGREGLLARLESTQQELTTVTQNREELMGIVQTAREDRDILLHDKYSVLLKMPDKAVYFVNMILLGVLRKYHHRVFWGDRLLTLDKTEGFWENPCFKQAYHDIVDSHLYDQYSGPDGIAWRLNTLVWAAQCALQLPGDFVECGVYKGDMSWVVAKTLDFSNKKKIFYLYDSFEGFSKKYSSEEDFPVNPKFFELADRMYKIPNLFEQVCDRFKDYKNIKIIKGELPDRLAEIVPQEIAYLHIDLNSPKAELAVLGSLFDRIVPGGIVIFDDYGWFEYIKQKRAIDEFMKSRGYDVLELPTGQGLVIKRFDTL